MMIKVLFSCLLTMLTLQKSSESAKNSSDLHILYDAILQDNVVNDGPKNITSVSVETFEDILRKIYNAKSDLSTPENSDCDALSLDSVGRNICSLSSKCLSGVELLSLIPHAENVTGDVLRSLCPLILFQAKQQVCLNDFGKVNEIKVKSKPSMKETWGFAILFVTIISLCSICGAVLIPFIKPEFYQTLLTYLVGLAVGSLASSAIFHLIPQTFGLMVPGEHAYLWKALVIISGIYLFFLTERLLQMVMKWKQRKQQMKHAKKIRVDNSHSALTEKDVGNCELDGCLELKSKMESVNGNDVMNHVDSGHAHHIPEPHSLCHHDHNVMFSQGDGNTIATVAYMIIFGDGLHNFIDGLSVGAAFSESILAGISISVAIICEEFPHELGDFAVLLNSGMSMKQALIYNFLSACTCYCGMIIGILLGELAEASTYIFAIAAGMFLYISLVDMVPEMNSRAEEASSISAKKALRVLLIQSLGMITGVSTLFILALYAESINFKN